MDHLSKFHLNRTFNEPGNVVLQKLCELEKRWRLAPRIVWRLAVQIQRRAVPVPRKYEKQHFS